jgi:hypothetical protein
MKLETRVTKPSERGPSDYRKPPSGFFRQIGNIHIHIDGGEEFGLVENLLVKLNSYRCVSKINAIEEFIAGPQRKEFPDTYQSHTPGTGSERLEFFSTSSAGTREGAVGLLSYILSEIKGVPGIVVEAERVVAQIDAQGNWKGIPYSDLSRIRAEEVGYEPAETLPFEIHHAFDVPLDYQSISLGPLLQETTKRGLRVGGWFRFAKHGCRAYRSNAFFIENGLQAHALAQHQALDGYLRGKRIQYKLWTVVEQVVGVWRSPLLPSVS